MDKKYIFLGLFIFMIIAISLFLTLDEAPFLEPNELNEVEEGPEEELEDVRFSILNRNQNHILWLVSERVDNYEAENRMELYPVEIEVYDRQDGKLLYTIEGDFGQYFSQEDYLELRGNVEIESERYFIETDELDYFLNEDFLEGRDSVLIKGRDFTSRAKRFDSDLNLRNLRLYAEENEKRAGVYFEEQEDE
ncbi:LPS export ABC transporter periplasmic protein LptC [Halanaerobium sp. Z-7514]|uniref:LPS export ABC transporter periplasmic protein LptC n=1 Tax=Halanaerobium polyolivorans TaxID=2886943 RepID=A0AAW4WUY6_9FIRM|nr:LPS export ABC transporter periplasmic protein LptC [Halanaerobium polyolivorans]MCC3144910.1 LPS export ABC transporter periplasmic protein LptC [Halanaerobium polyolivorans]